MTMEDLLTRFQFKLPYIDDKNNSELEAKSRTEFSGAIDCIGDISIDRPEGGLIDVTALLAVNLEQHPWNDNKIVTKASQFYEQLLLKHGSWEKLLRTHPKLCLRINKLISTTLTREAWQEHAIVCYLYVWYCHILKFPSVSEYLEVLLPPSLNFVDSYDDEMKVMGVKCLYHIMNESGKTELLWHGRAQVIYEAFQKLSYSKHEPLVIIIHPAMIKVLKVLEGDPTASKGNADEVYQRLLSDMYMEDKLLLRRAYANSMKLYVEHLQADIIKHLKRTMKITLNYLEDSCGSAELTRLTMLEVLEVVLKTARPRMKSYRVGVTKILLRLVVDTALLRMDTDSRCSVIAKVTSILKLIQGDEDRDYVKLSLKLVKSELPVKENDSKGRLLLGVIQQIDDSLS